MVSERNMISHNSRCVPDSLVEKINVFKRFSATLGHCDWVRAAQVSQGY